MYLLLHKFFLLKRHDACSNVSQITALISIFDHATWNTSHVGNMNTVTLRRDALGELVQESNAFSKRRPVRKQKNHSLAYLSSSTKQFI